MPCFIVQRGNSMSKFNLFNLDQILIKNKNLAIEAIPTPMLSKFENIKRPNGYNLPTQVSGSVTASLDSINIEGFADANPVLCETKATSEAIERYALKHFTLKNKMTETSSGWACHLSPELAIENAIFELIERDVALTNWEDFGTFFEVPETLWPDEIINWKMNRSEDIEFSSLKIYLTKNENGCCISALLFNKNNNFVAGHASRNDLDQAILSATSECMRAAHSALRFEYINDTISLHNYKYLSVVEPGAHSLAYAYSEALPKETNFEICEANKILNFWNLHQLNFKNLKYENFEIKLFKIKDRFVARVKSYKMREIYWGRNKFKCKNNYPHCVG
jgi:hypothetical protein